MRIVVLDGYTTNPGDLDWGGLQALGECAIYDRTPPDRIVARAKNAQILLTNKTVVDRDTIESLSKLAYVGVLATGYNIVDVEAATERNIVVANVPGYGKASISQAAIALLLELTNAVGEHSRTVHAGRWTKSKDFSYCVQPLTELAGLTIGIVGFGNVGQSIARLADAFGMKILVHTRTPKPEQAPVTVEFCTLEDLLRQSDVVTLHCPLTPATKSMINGQTLALMKPSAILINTARGPLINEAALAAALNSGRIAGAGLDVLCVEPPLADNPLLTAKNCVITPHISWASKAARARLLDGAVRNVAAFISGSPVNVVNP
jgi:glycerate dehydrogenase